MHASLMKTASW